MVGTSLKAVKALRYNNRNTSEGATLFSGTTPQSGVNQKIIFRETEPRED